MNKVSGQIFQSVEIRPVSCERGLSGRLEEVVPYKKGTTEVPFREDVRDIYFMGDNLLHMCRYVQYLWLLRFFLYFK